MSQAEYLELTLSDNEAYRKRYSKCVQCSQLDNYPSAGFEGLLRFNLLG